MPLKEAITIQEQVTIFIKDKDGNVHAYRVKTPWDKKPLGEKILTMLGLIKEPGTIQTLGKAACAVLYGGATGSYSRMLFIGSSWSSAIKFRTAAVTYTTATGILTYSNEAYPFTQVGSWTNVYLGPEVIDNGAYYHVISKAITTTTGISWWVQVQLTIS